MRFELDDLLPQRAGDGIARVGREIGDRVVAPVVGQTARDQRAFVEPMMDRQQLNGGDPEMTQVGDEPPGAPAQGTYLAAPAAPREQAAEALDVRLVDDRLAPGRTRGGASSPQSNAGSVTTQRGTNGASSRGLRRGRRRRPPAMVRNHRSAPE